MYRKGLSSRANKISSLVASTDNSGPGSIGQDSVPTAGAHGIRRNVFRKMPNIIPKKSKSSFSQMDIAQRPYIFQNKQELIDAIRLYFITDNNAARRAYGIIGSWNITKITDLSGLFASDAVNGGSNDIANLSSELNSISNWDVSRVTNLQDIFRGSKFNGDLSKWNVSNVTNFSAIFQNSLFNNNSIQKWDVRSATDFTNAFYNNTNFNTDLSYWNVPSNATLTNMFFGTQITPTTPLFTYFNKITILLYGNTTITHERTTTFKDPGAYTLTGEIPLLSSSNLDIHTTADGYLLTYTASNTSRFAAITSSITRTVNVVDGTPPLITLLGSSIMTLERGDTFNDPGATTNEGSLTSDILTAINDGTKNFTVGTYTITYTATDIAGNTSTLTRTVNVVDTRPPVISFPDNFYDFDGSGSKNYNGSTELTPVYRDTTNTNPEFNFSNGTTTDDVTAVDAGNVDLTANITNNFTDVVDVNTPGDYVVTYTVTDTYGNTATKYRFFKVATGNYPYLS